MSSKTINTDEFSEHLRKKSVDIENRRLLITNFIGTEQEQDLSEPPNCKGLGRIRHFGRKTSEGWPENPLPIDPVCRALDIAPKDKMRAQVFQNASCNWRCWYCYVPFELLSANYKFSTWVKPAELIDLYLDQSNPPCVIDLTGGQPDLVPEWVPWMMQEIQERGIEQQVYLWSDDNLSNDYFWNYLSDIDLERIEGFSNYGRVCCFKGFSPESFAFNTQADPLLFGRQFDLMQRFLHLKIDLYGYATFTALSSNQIEDDMNHFLDRLQTLDENLPLRIVPLEIREFTPMGKRLTQRFEEALKNQWIAIEAWQQSLECRFTGTERECCIVDVPLKGVSLNR